MMMMMRGGVKKNFEDGQVLTQTRLKIKKKKTLRTETYMKLIK